MKTTASFKFSDPIRKRIVAATPEEAVRQALLKRMIEELGYPKAFIAVEQKIPHLRRRVDLICYTNRFDPQTLAPLLIVECKKCSSEGAWQQLLGYNDALGAPFLSLADEKSEETFWLSKGELMKVPFLPAYEELCRWIR